MPLRSPSAHHRLTSLGLSAATLLTTSLGFVTLSTFVAPAPAIAQTLRPVPNPDPDRNILTVTGQGRESIPTNLTQVSLGIEVQAKTAQEVQTEIARRSTALIALLRSRNVEKLETSGVSLRPNYNNEGNRPKPIGYSGSNTISFRLATEKMGNLLDESVKAGASSINSIRFIASDEAVAEARQRALSSATRDAYAQAKTVLATLNLQPVEIAGVVINNLSSPNPRSIDNLRGQVEILEARRVELDAAQFTALVGGEQEIAATVSLRIRY